MCADKESQKALVDDSNERVEKNARSRKYVIARRAIFFATAVALFWCFRESPLWVYLPFASDIDDVSTDKSSWGGYEIGKDYLLLDDLWIHATPNHPPGAALLAQAHHKVLLGHYSPPPGRIGEPDVFDQWPRGDGIVGRDSMIRVEKILWEGNFLAPKGSFTVIGRVIGGKFSDELVSLDSISIFHDAHPEEMQLAPDPRFLQEP